MTENRNLRRWWDSWVAATLALVVTMFLVWAVVADRTPTREHARIAMAQDQIARTPGSPPDTRSALAPAPIYSYLEFAGVIGAPAQRPMTVRHDYTADGLRALAAALNALAPAYPETLRQQLIDALRARAKIIQETSGASSAATEVRNAFLSATTMIEAAGRRAEPSLRRLAESVNTEQALLSQGDTVRQFFRQSARAIRRLAAEPTVDRER